MEYTISQVTKKYDVTARMLRYYEQKGLITPIRRDDYAYRIYDEDAVRRLRLIIILRKLRIPLKQIAVIMEDNEHLKTLQILRCHIEELNAEIKNLDAIRQVLNECALAIEKNVGESAEVLLSSDVVMSSVSAIPLSENTFDKLALNDGQKERKISMADIKNFRNELNVRIVKLPPFTVASYHYVGQDPEEKTGAVMSEFVQNSRLYELKPDSRMFGFNRPNPGVLEDGTHGYEDWVTIPDGMEVPAPLTKKHFEGGWFAVMAIPFPEFQLWGDLIDWVNNNELYEADYTAEELAGQKGGFEEHYNWVWAAHNRWADYTKMGEGSCGIDLYVPVKLRKK
ncbi:MAG: effector binding domain-containing protein [Oscillospiraceae bacterium]|nr:effector binding domain-containing protein [Oscillospiraceae bacterium]